MVVNRNIIFLCFLIVCGLTQVLVIIESVIVKKKGGGVVKWWLYQRILEKYQHFNTFDTGIVNEQWAILKTSTLVNYVFFLFLKWIFELFKTFVGRFDWRKHINMDDTIPFWVIVRSGRWNVMNHIPTMGRPYLVVVVRGILLPRVILRRERRHYHKWISIFVWHQFRGGVIPLYWKWVFIWPYMGTPKHRRFLGKHKMCLT
jgi:hypothetical protein